MLEVDPGTAKLDLTVELREGPDGIRGAFEYHTELFQRATVAGLVSELVNLLAAATATPQRRLSELERPALPVRTTTDPAS
jgi:non-ribosomal peptide synthetase component F